MKLVKQASGKTTIKMSKSEWTDLGKKAGWFDFLKREPIKREPKKIFEGKESEISQKIIDIISSSPFSPLGYPDPVMQNFQITEDPESSTVKITGSLTCKVKNRDMFRVGVSADSLGYEIFDKFLHKILLNEGRTVYVLSEDYNFFSKPEISGDQGKVYFEIHIRHSHLGSGGGGGSSGLVNRYAPIM